jgi:hypothetical protein
MGFFKRFKKPKTSVIMDIPKHTVALGETLESKITVKAQEEYEATEIRAELRCMEKRRREKWVRQKKGMVRRVYWETVMLHSDNPKACDQLHLVPGLNKTFPININIPAGGRESFDSMDASISWYVKGVVAIDGRPDVTSRNIELQVTRSTFRSSTVEEKIIMVPCFYCETIMPQTSTSCPTCRAPRKK